ncbi:MAG: hypothetical protein ABH840_02555 [Nanoarchaeota archaeon]
MRKRGLFLLSLLVLFSIVLVYAQTSDSGKLVLNSEDEVNSDDGLISVNNLDIGDVFYIDGKKARVTDIENIVDNFDNQNFFANGVLVHNKEPVYTYFREIKYTRGSIDDYFEYVKTRVFPTKTVRVHEGLFSKEEVLEFAQRYSSSSSDEGFGAIFYWRRDGKLESIFFRQEIECLPKIKVPREYAKVCCLTPYESYTYPQGMDYALDLWDKDGVIRLGSWHQDFQTYGPNRAYVHAFWSEKMHQPLQKGEAFMELIPEVDKSFQFEFRVVKDATGEVTVRGEFGGFLEKFKAYYAESSMPPAIRYSPSKQMIIDAKRAVEESFPPGMFEYVESPTAKALWEAAE